MNLFSRLLRLHKRPEEAVTTNPSGAGRSPEEDFFTEIFAFVIQQYPNILIEWLNHDVFSSPRNYETIHVLTQQRFPPPSTKFDESRVDVLVNLSGDEIKHLIFLESKIGSKEGRDQLEKYAETIKLQEANERWILYVTRSFEEKNSDKFPDVNFKQLRWFQFYRILKKQPSNSLIEEVLRFMETTGLALGNKFTAQDLLTIQHLKSAVVMMEATLDGEIKKKFDALTATHKESTAYKGVTENGRYVLSHDWDAKWYCRLGFYPSEDQSEYPLLGMKLGLRPDCKARNQILAVMKEVVKEDGSWKAAAFDSPADYTRVENMRSLTTFLHEDDHVAAIRKFFGELLNKLEKIKNGHSDLPWV